MDVLAGNEVSMDSVSTNGQVELSCAPIFVLGVMPRSGTNFFYNLLCLHPHCHGVGIRDMPEDSLLYNANLLSRYVNNVSSFWSRHGLRGKDEPARQKKNEMLREQLFEHVGKGLLSYLEHLNPDTGHKPLVTKTPFVRNLKHFYTFFPNARLIILVRDGRAVTESNHKSFEMSYEVAMQRWTEAAREIIKFDQTYRDSDKKYLIIKYEDLLDHLEPEMKKVLQFLGMDVNAYDFETALNLPVFGSSEDFAKARQKILDDPDGDGWRVVKKDKKFNPKTRWNNWSTALHCRFNWVAGECMEQLGYELDDSPGDSPWRTLRNKFLDKKWALVTYALSMLYRIERSLYAFYLVRRQSKNLRMEEEDDSYWLA